MMRPRYHYAAAANWLSDPNGLVHHAGEWHMAYQYNPHGEEWGHMAWGHAVSHDLAHWQELPPALVEEDGTMIFSGSSVIDHANTAGFGTDAMVAIYTGARSFPPHQFQCLAASTDNGRTWAKYAGNPVLDRGMADFRDPNVIRHAASGQWIMAVVLSDENRAVLYGSHDLKGWAELSEIPTLAAPGHLWECPLLIELPVEGSADRRWLFKVDVLSGAPGSGALYLTGSFDGRTFVPDGPWQVADMGADFYAAIAWHEPRDAQGRPCWIGWMGNHAYQAKLPRQGWRGAMSLPRRMALRRDGGRLRLVQMVEPAVAELFGPAMSQTLELSDTAFTPSSRIIPAASARSWTIELAAPCGRHLMIARDGNSVRVQRQDPFTPDLDTVREATLPSGADLTIWLDHASIELLGEGGAMALSMQHRLEGAEWKARADRPLAVQVASLA